MTEVVQSAEVTLRVAVVVDADASLEEREQSICRKIRLEMGDEVEVKPPLLAENVTLAGVETIEEATERRAGQAESRAEGRLDDQRERHFDNNGHF